MLTPFLLEDFCNDLETRSVLNLSSATFPALELGDLFESEAALAKLLKTKLDYSEAYGSQKLREAIVAKLYAGSVSADDFLLTAGASEAIFILFDILAKPGATFVVQKPIYQSLYSVARDLGANIVNWDYSAELSPEENISSLRSIISKTSEITALVLCNPSNPLGVQLADEHLQSIAGLLNARTDKPLLIVDEVFRHSSLLPTSSALDFYEQAVVISDLSKAFSLPGLRLGWIATRVNELLEQALALRNYLSLRVSTLSEELACLAVEQVDRITERNRAIAQENFIYLCTLTGLPFEFPTSNIGAPLLYPRLKAELKTQEKLALITGDMFEDDPLRFRLGLGLEPGQFKRGIALLLECSYAKNHG